MKYTLTADQEAWLRDLETTTEPQARHKLHSPDGFCCLGRAAAVLDPGGEKEVEDGCSSWGGECDVLPNYLVDQLRLRDPAGGIKDGVEIEEKYFTALVEVNDDSGWTFKDIAAFIRKNPEKVFV